jgi:hypothetical protein
MYVLNLAKILYNGISGQKMMSLHDFNTWQVLESLHIIGNIIAVCTKLTKPALYAANSKLYSLPRNPPS